VLKKYRFEITSIVLGLIYVIYTTPLKLLNPYDTSWVFAKDPASRDLAGHAIGSMFYSIDVWRHPIGIIGNFGGDLGSSTLYWNSNPLFSLVQKLLFQLHLIPQNFQLIGIQIAIGIVFTGLSAFILTRKLGGSEWAGLLASGLLILSVSLNGKYFNDSLTWFFLCLFAMTLFISENSGRFLHWILLVAITICSQTYFLPFILTLFLLATLRTKSWRVITERISIIGLTSLFLYYEIGGFLISPGNRATSLESAKFLSCTLECLVDSRNFGLLSFGQPNEGTYEGWNYLGFSAILLLFTSLVLTLLQFKAGKFKWKKTFEFNALIVVSTGYFLISLGPEWRFGNSEFRPPLYFVTNPFFETFRATGRFAIPLVVFLICVASCQIDKLKFGKHKMNAVLFCLLLMTQYLEMTRLYEALAFEANVSVSKSLQYSRELDSLFRSHSGIQIIEANSGDIENIPWQEFSYYSLKNNYNIDSWHFLARFDFAVAASAQAQSVGKAIKCDFNANEIYLINEDIYKQLEDSCKSTLILHGTQKKWSYFTKIS
jgi:hypothetical protein